ncbi:MAG: hypothetical protein RIC55_11045 [Pirellulaceae bacterium]
MSAPLAVVSAQEGLLQASPQQVLQSHGLIRQGTGRLWIVASEVDLKRRLDKLPAFERTVKDHEQQLAARINRNAQDWAARNQAIKSLKSAKTDAQKRSLKQQIEQLKDACVKPEELGKHRDVQSLLIELATERNELLLSVLAARRDFEQMTAAYERLADEQQVQQALMKLSQDARLGPAQSYEAAMKQLDDVQRLVATDWQPLFQQSGLWRVNGIVDERAATTFTWEPKGDRLLLSGGVAELAGLLLVAGKDAELRFGGRRVVARRVVVPSLRFGGCLLHDIDAFILPPEAEDLGSRIGPGVFGSLEAEIQPERLRLLIRDPR